MQMWWWCWQDDVRYHCNRHFITQNIRTIPEHTGEMDWGMDSRSSHWNMKNLAAHLENGVTFTKGLRRQVQFQGFWWRLSPFRLARGMKDTWNMTQYYRDPDWYPWPGTRSWSCWCPGRATPAGSDLAVAGSWQVTLFISEQNKLVIKQCFFEFEINREGNTVCVGDNCIIYGIGALRDLEMVKPL